MNGVFAGSRAVFDCHIAAQLIRQHESLMACPLIVGDVGALDIIIIAIVNPLAFRSAATRYAHAVRQVKRPGIVPPTVVMRLKIQPQISAVSAVVSNYTGRRPMPALIAVLNPTIGSDVEIVSLLILSVQVGVTVGSKLVDAADRKSTRLNSSHV